MNCSDPKIGELLILYEFEALSSEEQRKFEAHLLSCDYCFQSLYELAPAMERLRKNPAHFLPALAPITTKLMMPLEASIAAIREFLRPIPPLVRIAISAAAVAVALFFLFIRPSAELADLALLEPAPYRALQVKSGAAATEAERRFEEGMAAYAQKDYANAIKKLSWAVRQDSTNASFQFYLGLSYLLAARVDSAIVHLQQTLALGGNAVLEKAHWYLGNAWLLKGDRAQAMAAFRKAMELEGDYQWEAEEIIGKIEKLPH